MARTAGSGRAWSTTQRSSDGPRAQAGSEVRRASLHLAERDSWQHRAWLDKAPSAQESDHEVGGGGRAALRIGPAHLLPSGPRSEVPGRLQAFRFSTDSFRIIFTEGYRAGKTAFLKLKERTDTKENRSFIITFRNHSG